MRALGFFALGLMAFGAATSSSSSGPRWRATSGWSIAGWKPT